MIIGRGDISKALVDRDDVTWFASGVSNSRETSPKAYQREMELLFRMPRDRHLVYFSSLCIYYGQNEYARHKRIMEQTIRNHFPGYTIVRIGNIDWGENPNTLINYLRAHPMADVKPVYRHILSQEEFKYWMGLIPVPGKNEMNIPGDRVWVPDLFRSLHPNHSAQVYNINDLTPNNADY